MSYSALLRLIKLATILVSVVCLGLFVTTTFHWPLVNDASLMHYIAFLTDHGFAPYRDIKDMNFPGGFLLDWGVMHAFGQGAIAWRVYDLALLVLAAIAMLGITWPNRFAGFLAAALFALFHGRDGIGQSGQRDLAIAVFVLWSYALSMLPGRSRTRIIFAIASGAMLATAATVKPTILGYSVLIGWIIVRAGQGHRNVYLPRLTAFCLGFALPILAVVVFLKSRHSLVAFWEVLHTLLPYHASLARQSSGHLFHEAFYGSLSSIAWITVVLIIVRGRWRSRETLALMAAVFCGYFSFYVQGKGLLYQRYPFIAFLLVLTALELTNALYDQRYLRVVSIIAILYMGVVLPPLYVLRASRDIWREDNLVNALSRDLRDIKGVELNRNIQCVDTVSGCINTLYRMRLIQSTGFLYDEFLFGPNLTHALLQEREEFWHELEAQPPKVIVVTGALFPSGPQDYKKLDRWPGFANYIESHYQLMSERSFEPGMTGPLSYRVYRLR